MTLLDLALWIVVTVCVLIVVSLVWATVVQIVATTRRGEHR